MNILEKLELTPGRKLPVVLSAELSECGLACLVMVGRYYGHDIDINGMRMRYSMSLAGANLGFLMDVARDLSFSSRALKVDLELISKVRLPAIIHWDLNHFVVLKEVKGERYIIHDPAMGRREVSARDFSDSYTGVVLELFPGKDWNGWASFTAKIPIKLSSLWSDIHGLVKTSVQLFLLSLMLMVISFVTPFFMQLVIDEAIGRADIDLLLVLVLGFGALFVMQALVTAVRGWAMQVIAVSFTFQLKGNLVRHLLRLPASYFERRHLGDILSRIGSLGAIQDALTRGIITSILDGIMALIAVVILFLYSPTLAIVTILAVLLSLGAVLLTYPLLKNKSQELLFAQAKESTYLMESVRAAPTVKIMGRGAIREGRWRNLFAGAAAHQLSLAKIQMSLGFFNSFILAIQTGLVVFLGAKMVLLGEGFSVGMLMAFLSYRQTFSERAMSLIQESFQFRLLSLHLQRLSDIVASKPEAPPARAPLDSITGDLKLRNVSFRYGDPDPLVLDRVDLDVPAGDFLAITGPSGSGKSTLLKLMLGAEAPTSGEILVEGLTGTPELWETWRERVGVVFQDDRLLSGSLAENIAFFDPHLDMSAVKNAAKSARVHDEIMRMPMQYQALVGDMGSALSSGQRQRILLARALYRQPEVLFLDEGTAHLDEAAEEAIADLIAALPITRIIVAHRPALIQRANRVAVVQGGSLSFVKGAEKVVAGSL